MADNEQQTQQRAENEQPESQGEQQAEAQAEQQTAESQALLESVEGRIQELEEQLAAARDQLLRAQAETQNTRRRAQQDVEKAHKFALDKFGQELLPVVDNLERALASIDRDEEQLKPLAEGVDLTLKLFLETMSRHQIVQVDPAGEPFDPQLHEAVTMVENNEVEAGTVLEVIQKGYTLNERLIRAAMVVVSKNTQADVDTKV